MSVFRTIVFAGLGIGIVSFPANASIVITQSAGAAPTYATTLNFDEPGGPTGNNVPNDSWDVPPWNIPVFSSGDVIANDVGDHSAFTGQGTNSYVGPFGVFIEFGQDLTEMSFQGWDDSGPGGAFGGGAAVAAYNDGSEVASIFITPAYGGAGDSWFNITTSGGMVFDQIAFLGFGFFPQSYVDNLSWNAVPEPGSLALLAIGGVAMIRRRGR